MERFNLWAQTPGDCFEIPVLEYYPASQRKSNAAIVIFPGGGYCGRASYEGEGYANYLNTAGFDAFVCEYRVHPHKFPLPLLDARRAIRFIRYYASKFDIASDKIIVMGSSAGGHLAALVSTYFNHLNFENNDSIDRVDYVPNGQILCYPVISFADDTVGHIGSKLTLLPHEELLHSYDYSPELIVSASTPPAFIWHTSDDSCVNVTNSYVYASSLKKKNIPVEMHVFPHGPHGMGIAANDPIVSQWTKLLVNWLHFNFD